MRYLLVAQDLLMEYYEHSNSVVIENNQKSDKPNQLKIGNNDISVSRDITDEEFQEILATFKSVRDALPK